jgi:hypothetical protein
METLIAKLFIQNWQRKCLALLMAIILWAFVNHSIQETKVIPSVPIRVVNLPPDKTIVGLLPNGVLNKRITLTLTGSTDVIKELEPGDLEVLFDASTIDRDEWVLQISKKNLVSLNPSIDLVHHVTQVYHPEYIIHMSRLLTARVPINVLPPIGEAPQGYEFLDVWPQKLMQTVSGPEQEVENLKSKGLEVVFDLNEITKAHLDGIKSSHLGSQDDEITFLVPHYWKQVAIPFHNNALEEINDSEAQNLRIDFLRKEFIPVGKEIPINIFYPLKYSETLNPETTSLAINKIVQKKNGLTVFMPQLYIYDVSRLFLDIVRDNMTINIVAAPKDERDTWQWSVEIVNPRHLEDTYVAFIISDTAHVGNGTSVSLLKSKEVILRKRFREYLEKFTLYTSLGQKLALENRLDDHLVKVKLENE